MRTLSTLFFAGVLVITTISAIGVVRATMQCSGVAPNTAIASTCNCCVGRATSTTVADCCNICLFDARCRVASYNATTRQCALYSGIAIAFEVAENGTSIVMPSKPAPTTTPAPPPPTPAPAPAQVWLNIGGSGSGCATGPSKTELVPVPGTYIFQQGHIEPDGPVFLHIHGWAAGNTAIQYSWNLDGESCAASCCAPSSQMGSNPMCHVPVLSRLNTCGEPFGSSCSWPNGQSMLPPFSFSMPAN